MIRKWRSAIAWTATLIVLGTMLLMVPAFADHEPRNLPTPDVGVLQLHMGTDGDAWIYKQHNASGGYDLVTTQAFSANNKCEYVPPASGTPIVSLTAAPGKVGLINHELGVKSSGSSCSSVEKGEGPVVIQLAGALAEKEIDYFEIDIELKQSVKVTAEMFLGATSVGTAEITCDPTGDCGNDSNGDNSRWEVVAATPFNKLVLSVSVASPNNGNFSLAGGLENTVRGLLGSDSSILSSDSLFHITDIARIGCDQGIDAGGTDAALSSLYRGTDAGGGCSGDKYGLHETTSTSEEQTTHFIELSGVDCNVPLNARFLEKITWEPIASTDPTPGTLEYNHPCLGDGAEYFPMQACMVDPRTNKSPLAGGTLADIDPTDVLPADELYCVVETDHVVVGSNDAGIPLIKTTHIVYWIGDGGTRYK